MTEDAHLTEELERRLAEVEQSEHDDPVHAALSGRSLTVFLSVVALIAVVSWIGVAL